jgi:hypothetical protein
MSVAICARHYFLGLSDELAVRNRDKSNEDSDADISAEARIKLYPRPTMSSEQDHGIDQLFHCRKHLIWSSENRERVRFEASGPIADAELCCFAEEPASWVLCVSEPGLLSMYSTDGDLHEHALKLPVRALWPTPVGVLAESFEGIPAQVATHMIGGLQRVRALNCDNICGIDKGGTYAWEDERVLFTHPSTPVAVTSDSSISALRIWCLKAFPEGVLPDPADPFPAPAATSAGTPSMPPSAMSSTSRVRTPEDHIQAHVFTAYRSGEPGTASTWMADKVLADFVSPRISRSTTATTVCLDFPFFYGTWGTVVTERANDSRSASAEFCICGQSHGQL